MATTDKSDHWLNVVFRETPYIIPGVEGVVLPIGTTAERPVGAPELQNGLIRYNGDTNLLEAYLAGTWQDLVAGNVPEQALLPLHRVHMEGGGECLNGLRIVVALVQNRNIRFDQCRL